MYTPKCHNICVIYFRGGIQLTVIGDNLQAVGDPQLLTNLVIRTEQINDNYTTVSCYKLHSVLKHKIG